jgi:hypothetical protein
MEERGWQAVRVATLRAILGQFAKQILLRWIYTRTARATESPQADIDCKVRGRKVEGKPRIHPSISESNLQFREWGYNF